MATDTFVVLAASYDMLGATEGNYQAAGDLYLASGLIDTYVFEGGSPSRRRRTSRTCMPEFSSLARRPWRAA